MKTKKVMVFILLGFIAVGFYFNVNNQILAQSNATGTSYQWQDFYLSYPVGWEVFADKVTPSNQAPQETVHNLGLKVDEVTLGLALFPKMPDPTKDTTMKSRPVAASEAFCLPIILAELDNNPDKVALINYGLMPGPSQPLPTTRFQLYNSKKEEASSIDCFVIYSQGKGIAGFIRSPAALGKVIDNPDINRRILEAYDIVQSLKIKSTD